MSTVSGTSPARGEVQCERQADDTLLVRLVGHWTMRTSAPVVTEVYQQLDASPPVRRLAFAAQALTAWDSRLLTFLRQVMEASTHRQIIVDQHGLPQDVRRLLALAAAVPEREGARCGAPRSSWLARIGTAVLASWKGPGRWWTALAKPSSPASGWWEEPPASGALIWSSPYRKAVRSRWAW